MGGLLTNYHNVKKVVKHYLDLIKQKEAGDWAKYTKKEQIELARELEKLDLTVSGLSNMKGLPKAIFLVDIKKEKTALLESNVMGIPVVAICDTNVNPKLITYPIILNLNIQSSFFLIFLFIKFIEDYYDNNKTKI